LNNLEVSHVGSVIVHQKSKHQGNSINEVFQLIKQFPSPDD